jgi:methyl-accepting chemotaxis protein
MSLSWKQKFALLTAATFIGLAIALAASLSGLNKVSEAYEARSQARAYQTASLNLMNDWLNADRVSENLTPAIVEGFSAQLTSLESQAGELASAAARLDDASIASTAADIQDSIINYAGLKRDWLARNQALGLTSNDGLKAKMADLVENGLRSISISLFNDDINIIIANYDKYLETYEPGYAEKTRDALARMLAIVEEMDWQEIELGQAVQNFAGAFAEAETLVSTIANDERRLEAIGATIRELITNQGASLRTGIITSTSAQAEDARETSAWFVVGIFVAVILVLVLTLTGASRTLVRRLNEVVELLTQVASGDLSQRLEPGRNARDEFNRLGQATNKMLDDVSSVIEQVVQGNKNLASLQTELDALVVRLARNGEQVDEGTEQTATAVQEISHTAVDIAKYTQSVNDAAQNASGAANSGAQVVKRSAQTMSSLAQRIQQAHNQVEQLSKTGEKVNSIVDVINSLAEQTNLLALNAAIEAARAGEAGRGFSVVADEVRSLAEKTVSATNGIADIVGSLNRETSAIATMMKEGLQSASEGEKNAEEAAGAINEITGAIDQLANDMNQVVSSVEGISDTTEEIAQKVEQIHGHTRETAEVRQQLNAHIERLSAQTVALTRASEGFRL